ncbi:MAG: SMI1/KNR4 family protein [Candidatus Thiodiazotropha lotti]|nr:SMI1/KNR4 family protein [Candidatus Thiodiazotropha lotti]
MNIIENYKQQYQGSYNGAVNEEAVDEVLSQFSVTNESYRNWLIQTGGGPIGSDWLDGINELEQSQEKLKNEPWAISGFVIGWDGAGNPIVINSNGEIITEDHNFSGAHKMASSFNELLAIHVSS